MSISTEAQELASDGFPVTALRPNWEEMRQMSRKLGNMVSDHCAESGKRFDGLVILPRGGYFPGETLARQFGFGAAEILHLCVGSYAPGETKSSGMFTYGQAPSREQVEGKDLLVVDEVCDSGRTLEEVVRILREELGARAVSTAVLHYKPERSETGFAPDFYVEETDQWIVYPWELDEAAPGVTGVRRLEIPALAPAKA